MANGEKLCDRDYAEDLVRLFESMEHERHGDSSFVRDVLAPSWCKVLL